jgi:uncharacterized protein
MTVMPAMTKFLSLPLLLFIHSVTGHAAGFDCNGERLLPVEKLICSDAKLSAYDEHLNNLFHKTIGVSTAYEQRQVLDEQRQWRTEVRDRCDSWICLHGAYQSRFDALSNTYQIRWQARIPDSVLITLSRRSAISIEDIKAMLSDCHGSQMNMNLCAFRSSIEADQAMRSVLAKKLETLALCRETFQASQDNWEKDRDSRCKKEADGKTEDVSVRPMILSTCQARATEQHTMQLKSIKSCDSIQDSME